MAARRLRHWQTARPGEVRQRVPGQGAEIKVHAPACRHPEQPITCTPAVNAKARQLAIFALPAAYCCSNSPTLDAPDGLRPSLSCMLWPEYGLQTITEMIIVPSAPANPCPVCHPYQELWIHMNMHTLPWAQALYKTQLQQYKVEHPTTMCALSPRLGMAHCAQRMCESACLPALCVCLCVRNSALLHHSLRTCRERAATDCVVCWDSSHPATACALHAS